jgi:hypothetical protein
MHKTLSDLSTRTRYLRSACNDNIEQIRDARDYLDRRFSYEEEPYVLGEAEVIREYQDLHTKVLAQLQLE